MKVSRSSEPNNKHLYALSAVLFLGIIGTFAYALGRVKSNDQPPSSSIKSTNAEPEILQPGQPIDTEEAREIALTQKPDGVVARVEPKPQTGTVSVQFTDGTKLEIANDGSVVQPEETKPEPSAPTQTPDSTTVQPEESTPPSSGETQESPSSPTPPDQPSEPSSEDSHL